MANTKPVSHARIVAAAQKEFEQYGFKDASMRNIATEAGMSASGLYKHFPSKEEMFASLVDPTIEAFEREYRERESREYAELGNEGVVTSEQMSGNRWAMGFIYDHIEAFRLLINKSDGTMYENYTHKVALLEETATMMFIEELRRIGRKPAEISRKEMHLLVTTQVNALFEVVKHGFTREEAMQYADKLDRFFMPGWFSVLGVEPEQ